MFLFIHSFSSFVPRTVNMRSTFFFFKLFFIGSQLIYNVVLVSAVQQIESVKCIHTSTLSLAI